MNRRRIITALLLAALAASVAGTTGCTYRKYVDIGPDQTAFAIPYQGDTQNQSQLFSEEFLSKNQVSAKRYMIPYVRLKTNSFQLVGEKREAVKLILVDLKPVTRAWTGAATSGTASVNQALIAETKESVAFSAEFNCSAAVDEANAAKFVHYYYGKPLEEVMDSQIRPYAQQLFTEKCAEYTLDELLLNKAPITKYVRDGVTKFYADRGINILTLGMQGEITYLNDAIQQSIDKRIQSQNDYLAQQAQNKKRIEMAEAANREAKLLSGDTAIRLRELDIQRIQADTNKTAAEKWDGHLPSTMVPGGSVPFLGVK